jgi:hypothetical protein
MPFLAKKKNKKKKKKKKEERKIRQTVRLDDEISW